MTAQPIENAAATVTGQGTCSQPGTRSLIDEIESAVREASHERRVQLLRNVTDLFVGSANAINQEQVELFGNVLEQLITQVENDALCETGTRLAQLENAPRPVIQKLARNDAIAVAGPVLAYSVQLTDHDLIEIAQTKGQQHLDSISERQKIAATVTDILVERGNNEVLRKLSRNQGAAFSRSGFQQLTSRAADDEVLTEGLAQRLDLPSDLLQEVVSKATETLRERLLAQAPPSQRVAIQAAIGAASIKILRQTAAARDFSEAEADIAAMAKYEQLTEAAILNFANTRQYEHLVAGIAYLNSAPVPLIDQLMNNPRHEGIIVACKAASLHWPTVYAILNNRFTRRKLGDSEIERARFDFVKLTAATARRAFRFWVIRGTSESPALN
ncbi:MAG: DUF2336 domain-containing protein [Pseudolabrys sp.]